MEKDSQGSGFARNKVRYFGGFAIRHRLEMKRLIEGRVLGKESSGWRNVAEHNLLAGVVAYKIGELVGLSREDQEEVTSVATTHDWDKRLDKERIGQTQEARQGGTWVTGYDIEEEIKLELGKSGLVRVTGEDWRNLDTWGVKEKVLRYVDSSLIPTTEGRADFVNWQVRLAELSGRRPEAGEIAGMRLYGKSSYDRLAEITEAIEGELHEIILARNPALAERYTQKEMLHNLILDQITQDIKEMRIR